jgi:hypothetical protein
MLHISEMDPIGEPSGSGIAAEFGTTGTFSDVRFDLLII